MKKVNNLLVAIIFLSSLIIGEECSDDIAPDVQIEQGDIEISDNIKEHSKYLKLYSDIRF